MMDGSARYSMTDRVLPYPIPGQFADDGDNYQIGLNFSLIKILGANGQFMLMPSLGITRSEYQEIPMPDGWIGPPLLD